MALGNHAQALKHLKEVLPLVQASEDRQWEGMILGDIAFTYFQLGEKDQAFEFLSNRLACERKHQNPIGEAEALKSMGVAYESAGDKKKAVESYKQALSIYFKISRTTESEYLKSTIRELREIVSKLER